MNSEEIASEVKSWYGSETHWRNSVKTQQCVDYRIVDQGNLLRDKVVLNIGCFYPADEIHFGGLTRHWTSIDFTPEVISRCKLMNVGSHVEFRLMDARRMEFRDHSFDVVLDFSSGDQMPESHFNEVLLEVHRVLKTDGLFVITFANFNYFKETQVLGDYGYTRIYAPVEIEEKLKRGFKLIREEDLKSDRAGMVFQKLEVL